MHVWTALFPARLRNYQVSRACVCAPSPSAAEPRIVMQIDWFIASLALSPLGQAHDAMAAIPCPSSYAASKHASSVKSYEKAKKSQKYCIIYPDLREPCLLPQGTTFACFQFSGKRTCSVSPRESSRSEGACGRSFFFTFSPQRAE